MVPNPTVMTAAAIFKSRLLKIAAARNIQISLLLSWSCKQDWACSHHMVYTSYGIKISI